MLQEELAQESINWEIFVFILMIMFWTYIDLFMVCYFGEELTTAFEELTNEIYRCEWNLFPNCVQRILPIVLQISQQPVQIKGFASFVCSRDTFKKVVNGGYSYFTILRKFQ
ncbi:odorant receptor 94b-like [Contarinia nasturtii]|uniref:odorant receptor 94b-like n=1 Tax=Contarinia nasturtii TaxID=265458 RepID=UPI0012D4A3D9|nr:odorant receptor 94b-like [Contarinia nasturtii]